MLQNQGYKLSVLQEKIQPKFEKEASSFFPRTSGRSYNITQLQNGQPSSDPCKPLEHQLSGMKVQRICHLPAC
jgi:hypothetical protein